MEFGKISHVAAGLALGTLILTVSPSSAETAATPPPAPRPWNSEPAPASTSVSSQPATAPNGSRLKVTPEAVEQSQAAQARPRFNVDPPLRDGGGYYVGVSAGLSFAQNHDDDTPGLDINTDVSPTGGFKFGYVYPFDPEPIDQFMSETGGRGLRLAGALELEAFYLRNDGEVSAAGIKQDFSIDAGYVMLNAFLRASVSDFAFYVGPGVGFAYANVSGDALNSEQDDIHLAYQFIGGVEYFIRPEWSVFSEYKWLVTEDYDVNFAVAGDTDLGSLNQHLISFGLKHHF